jgi:predicted amidohydrolase YtcJ
VSVGAPDTILTGGEVLTGSDGWVQAVAVRDGVIAALGTADALAATAGPATRIVELGGATVLPGFIDAHVHPRMGGVELRSCALAHLTTAEEYLAAVAAYAVGLPDGAWITGGGWSMSAFERGLPVAGPLDAVTGGRPAILYNRDHHSAWVNRAALRLAAIDAGTADPVGGRIEREAGGAPTGALHESAMDLVADLVPDGGAVEDLAGLRAGVEYLNRLGITGWQDAKVTPRDIEAYLALQREGALTARVTGAYWLDPELGPDQVAVLLQQRAAIPDGLFRLSSAKIMLDGVCETHTAALSRPYLDGHGHATANSGLRFWDDAALIETAGRLDDAGIQLHFHAVGDAAVTQALDTVAALRATRGPLRHRPHVAHVQVVRPDDVPRFRALGVSVNAQPLWARLEQQMTELTLPFLDADLGRWQYPFGDLENAGAVLAIGSDWPVSTPDPIRLLHVAVNRTPVPGGTTWRAEDGSFLPDQRLSLPVALGAYTRGSAWLNSDESVSGVLEVGRSADFAVLDSNPFSRPRTAIWQSRVLATWFSGRRVAAGDGP